MFALRIVVGLCKDYHCARRPDQRNMARNIKRKMYMIADRFARIQFASDNCYKKLTTYSLETASMSSWKTLSVLLPRAATNHKEV